MIDAAGHTGAKWGRNEAVVALAIIAATILVWPVGDYAVLDDWAYVKPLEHLHFDGRLIILDYLPMSTVGHLFWGVIFTKLFGFSFTTTKLSVVVLCLIESVVMLRLLALCGVGRNLALAAVLALVFNPLHFLHASLFMTDVPSLTWQILAIFCYLKGLLAVAPCSDSLRTGSARRGYLWLIAGSAAAGEAYLIRQNGILVPLAVVLYLALYSRRLLTPRILFASLAPAALIIGNFTYWYNYVHGPTSYFQNRAHQVASFLSHAPLKDLPLIIFSIVAYAGWFLIPLAMSMPLRTFRWPTPTRNAVFVGIAFLVVNSFVYFTVEAEKIFPYIWNVITPCGLFCTGEFMIDHREILWGQSVGLVLGAACFLAVLALVQRLICGGLPAVEKNHSATRPPAFPATDHARLPIRENVAADVAVPLVSILLALQLCYALATSPLLFDRHLLLFAPTVMVLFCLACREIPSVSLVRYLPGFALMVFYSVATTHDVHALSRATFQAASDLVTEGIDPRTIDAGFAFNGWATYEQYARTVPLETPSLAWWQADVWRDRFNERTDDRTWTIGWPPRTWWMGTISAGTAPKYAVASPAPAPGTPPRFRIVRESHYRSWWPWKMKPVCVVQSID